MDRRTFLKSSVLPAAGLSLSACLAPRWARGEAGSSPATAPGIVDTNVSLFSWPFRRLKYGQTKSLVDKLRGHRVEQAWAANFEALLHKNLDAANRRLAEECRGAGEGFLIPFGSVNPAWPDWEEDLRRCQETYEMPGIRLYPSYHNYTFEHPEFARLLRAAAERGLLVQIALRMEDPRVHHPIVDSPRVDTAPLIEALEQVPEARVQLLNWSRALRGRRLEEMVEQTGAAFDISHIEGVGGVGRILAGDHPFLRAALPPNRLLYGSHAPYFPCESAVLRLFESPLNAEQLDLVMHRTARRLFDGNGAGEAVDSEPATAVGQHAEPDAMAFALDPAEYGVPNRDALVDLRIWDLHYHGFNSRDGVEQHKETMVYVQRMGVERVFALDIAGSRRDPFTPSGTEEQEREILSTDDQVAGIIRIDPSDPSLSCQKMEEWIREGPCVGIKYAGFNREGIPCSHPNNFPIIELAQELDAVVYIHTWLKVGGEPRHPGGGNNPGESTPMDVAKLAERFPKVPLICGHSGGDWELGVRAVRPYKNVYFEFAGSDPHSGQVDLAVKELGSDRIVWGGHGPSRSYATELSKVLDADLNDKERMQILGGNLRRIAKPIFRRKGYKI